MISIVVPIHNMVGGDKFLWRLINSIMDQTYKDYEIIITRDGKMAENTNAGIKKAKGDLIKILYLDDYLAHKDALKDIVENFKGQWMITGVSNHAYPYWADDIETGNNKLGSPSALTIKNDNPLLFDETMSWLLDCDYYKRMYEKFGAPQILNGVHVVLGEHAGQMTNILTDEEKRLEAKYMKEKYE